MKKFILAAVFGAACLIAYFLLSSDNKPNREKYSQEEWVVISETDTLGVEIRCFLLNIKTKQIVDSFEHEDLYSSVTVCVDSTDYERLHSGNVTDEELSSYAFDIMMAYHEDEIEWCHITNDKDGKVVEHYHTKAGKVVPSEVCGVHDSI